MAKQNRSTGFLGDGQCFVTNNKEKADLLNNINQSVLSPNDYTAESYQGQSVIPAPSIFRWRAEGLSRGWTLSRHVINLNQ